MAPLGWRHRGAFAPAGPTMTDDRTVAAIDAAIRHLEAARREAEEAAVVIVQAVDEIGRSLPPGPQPAPVQRILQACTFQDIIGQRLSKVTALLDHLRQRRREIAAAPPVVFAEPADGLPREQIDALFSRGRAPQGVPWRRGDQMKPKALKALEESFRRDK